MKDLQAKSTSVTQDGKFISTMLSLLPLQVVSCLMLLIEQVFEMVELEIGGAAMGRRGVTSSQFHSLL